MAIQKSYLGWAKITLFVSIFSAVTVVITIVYYSLMNGYVIDFSNTAWGAILGFGGGALVTNIIGIPLRGIIDERLEKIRGDIQKKIQIEIEQNKGEITKKVQIEVETSKAQQQKEAQSFIEYEKAKLQQQADLHKHELEKLVVSAKLRADKTFKILPELWSRIRAAQGSLTRWYGWHSTPNWEIYTSEELKQRINSIHSFIPEKIIDNIINDFEQANPLSKRKVVDEALEPIERSRALHLIQEAVNYRIENELFLPDDINKYATDALGNMRAAVSLVERRHDKSFDKGIELEEKSQENIKALRIAMRMALDPIQSSLILPLKNQTP